MEKNNTTKTTGISFTGLLTIVFITLKLCGVIDWSWIWVLAPIWIPFAILIAIVTICLLIVIIKKIIRKIKKGVDKFSSI